ncbi:fimbrillin family protein [Hallella absiana]|uniref:fimbrillin family protein n=1 Tax=Hallella absiana TaxID=2925336 RepID=UPI0021C9AAF9|nr:fimbrillin family protein [Hallella absiana]
MRLRHSVSKFRSCDLLLLSLSALSFLTSCSETLTDSTPVLSFEPISFKVDAIDGTPVAHSSSASAKASRGVAAAAISTAPAPDPQSYFAAPLKTTGGGHTLYLHPLVSERVGGAMAAKVTDEPITRGTRIESLSQLKQFGVSAIPYANDNAFASATPNSLFYNETATNASYGWKTANEHYWPATDKVAFYAYAPIPSSSNGLTLSSGSTQGTPYIDYALPATAENQPDLIVATNKGLTLASVGTNKAVPLTFDHQLTSIRFVAGPDMPSGKITSVGFTNIATKGRLSLGGNWSTTAAGNYTISNMSLQLTGSDNQEIVSSTKTLLMIPQSFTTDNQKIAITYVFDNNTYNLTGSLKGTSWDKGQSIVYKVSPHSVSKLQLGSIAFATSWGNNYPKTAFAAGDAVGIYVADASGLKYSNVKLTLGSDGKWTPVSRVLLPENCRYYVYYPYSTSGLANTGKAANDAATFFASGISTWNPNANQSTLANLYNSDLQVAAGVVSTTTASTVNFSMSHQMGLAVINLGQKTHYDYRHLSTDANFKWLHASSTVTASSSFSGNMPYKNGSNYMAVVRTASPTVFKSVSTDADKWSLSFQPSAGQIVTKTAISARADNNDAYVMAVGDVYYSDGDMSHQSESLISGKTPIGIVGYIGSNYWTEKNTKSSSVGGHALVMCLKTIGSTGTTNHGTSYQWKTSDTDDGRSKVNTSALIIGSSTQAYGSGYKESVALNNSAHPAAQAALAYTALKAPSTSTGWFLPTAGQYYAIMHAIGGYPSSGWNINDWVSNMTTVSSKVNTALSKVGANNYTEFFQAVNTWEWISTELSAAYTIIVDSGVDDGQGAGSVRFIDNYYNNHKTVSLPVRPFLAF